MALDVVSIAEATKFFLACGIPNVEAYGAKVGGELKWVDFDTKGGWDLTDRLEYANTGWVETRGG